VPAATHGGGGGGGGGGGDRCVLRCLLVIVYNTAQLCLLFCFHTLCTNIMKLTNKHSERSKSYLIPFSGIFTI
jgi:hypothetical protein